MKPIIVIYEDDALQIQNFGPHRFMMALAFDVEKLRGTTREVFETAFRPLPKKGADKVINMLCDDVPTVASDTAKGAAIVALLDSDRLQEMVNRRFKSSFQDVESARAGLEREARKYTPGVFVRLVDWNIEWVCSQLIAMDPQLVAPAIASEAVGHDRASRDELLRAASLGGVEALRARFVAAAPLIASARDCLVECFRQRVRT